MKEVFIKDFKDTEAEHRIEVNVGFISLELIQAHVSNIVCVIP